MPVKLLKSNLKNYISREKQPVSANEKPKVFLTGEFKKYRFVYRYSLTKPLYHAKTIFTHQFPFIWIVFIFKRMFLISV